MPLSAFDHKSNAQYPVMLLGFTKVTPISSLIILIPLVDHLPYGLNRRPLKAVRRKMSGHCLFNDMALEITYTVAHS